MLLYFECVALEGGGEGGRERYSLQALEFGST